MAAAAGAGAGTGSALGAVAAATGSAACAGATVVSEAIRRVREDVSVRKKEKTWRTMAALPLLKGMWLVQE